MDVYINSLSNTGQIILARLLVRKRKWYNIREHLTKYVQDDGSSMSKTRDDQLKRAVDELIDN